MMIDQGLSIELLEMTSVMVIIKRTNVAISVITKEAASPLTKLLTGVS